MGENRSLDEFHSIDALESEADGDGSDDSDGGVTSEGENGDGEAVTSEDEDGNESVDGEGDGPTPRDLGDVEPARATYRWDPEGGRCGVCGESVDRRWWDDSAGRDDPDSDAGDAGDRVEDTSEASAGAFVCGDCKQW